MPHPERIVSLCRPPDEWGRKHEFRACCDLTIGFLALSWECLLPSLNDLYPKPPRSSSTSAYILYACACSYHCLCCLLFSTGPNTCSSWTAVLRCHLLSKLDFRTVSSSSRVVCCSSFQVHMHPVLTSLFLFCLTLLHFNPLFFALGFVFFS